MLKDKLKLSTNTFLEKYVYHQMKIKEMTDDNANQIVDYIVSNYIAALVMQKENENYPINEDLLDQAEQTVDDINNN